jgi:hypothetical protein
VSCHLSCSVLSWPLHQLDVNNAFLNGLLTKIIYMEQPFGYTDPRFHHHVCKLRRSSIAKSKPLGLGSISLVSFYFILVSPATLLTPLSLSMLDPTLSLTYYSMLMILLSLATILLSFIILFNNFIESLPRMTWEH